MEVLVGAQCALASAPDSTDVRRFAMRTIIPFAITLLVLTAASSRAQEPTPERDRIS